jgi:4a-hydroxytetrahydrobiopterin dehydratase
MTEPHNLAEKSCIPCKGDVPPLAGSALLALIDQLSPEWSVENGHHLICALI